MEEIFTEIYKTNGWKDNESVSGRGSTLENTIIARTALKSILGRYDIKSMLDIPCGDSHWMSTVDLGDVKYLGADIVPELVELCRDKNRGKPYREFVRLDVTKDDLPRVDLVFCRDMFGHFSNAEVKKALHNIRLSGSKYLMATTFPNFEENMDIKTGAWRPINLDHYFGLPRPIEMINEQCMDGNGQFADKSLGLWRLGDE